MGYEAIDNKVALITGGSEGIGYGIAKTFIEAGAKVAITGRNIDNLERAKESLGSDVLSINADVAQVETSTSTVDNVINKFGKLDILVNNAGEAIQKPISQSTIEDFDQVFNTNVRGLFAQTQAAIPELKKTHGNIIIMGSSLGMRPMPIYGVYSASKAAVIMFTQIWAKDLAPDVRVNSISPGGVDTPLWDKLIGKKNKKEVLNFIKDRHLLKKLGNPEEIGRAALYLATEDWLTGSNFVVDGGLFYSI